MRPVLYSMYDINAELVPRIVNCQRMELWLLSTDVYDLCNNK